MQNILQKVLIFGMTILFGVGLDWLANKYTFVDATIKWLGFMVLTLVFMAGLIWIVVVPQ